MKRFLVSALLALAALGSNAADVAISALPAASGLAGTEAIPAVQSGVTVKTTPAAVRAYLLGTPSTWTAAQTFVAPLLGTPASGVATNLTGTATGLTAGSATALATGRTIGITGDLTYTSPSFDGSGNVTAAGTLATVNSNTGTFTLSTITVNAKGLITAASSGSGSGVTSIGVVGQNGVSITGSPVTSTGTVTVTLSAITPTSISTGTSTATMSIVTDGGGHVFKDSTTGFYYNSGSDAGGVLYRIGGNIGIRFGIQGKVSVRSDGMFAWSSAIPVDATFDTGMARAAARKVEINNGTAGSLGDLSLRQLYPDFTNTATVGAVTINKAAGKAIVGAATTSTVVTNSLVTANSQVICTVNSNDATATLKNCTPTAGSFTITTTAAATADTNVAFIVFNQ